MSETSDTRDRVIGLERDVKYLTAEIVEMAKKVDALHDLFTQAKGVRWAVGIVLTLGAFVGGMFGGKIGAWFGFLPK